MQTLRFHLCFFAIPAGSCEKCPTAHFFVKIRILSVPNFLEHPEKIKKLCKNLLKWLAYSRTLYSVILRARTSNCEISKYGQRAVGPFSCKPAHFFACFALTRRWRWRWRWRSTKNCWRWRFHISACRRWWLHWLQYLFINRKLRFLASIFFIHFLTHTNGWRRWTNKAGVNTITA